MDKRNFIEKIDTKMGEMSVKYVTPSGIACTKEEEKVIDAFRRVVKKWNKGSDDLYIMMGPNYLHSYIIMFGYLPSLPLYIRHL